jgi:spermidine/putrescine-binding protein
MLDDPEDMLGACLKKLGLPFSATDPAQLARAARQATAQQAIDAAPHLAFVYPAEGFPFYCDCAVILRESRRARLAHHFLDYLLRPAVSAKIVEATRTLDPATQRLRDRIWTEIKSA